MEREKTILAASVAGALVVGGAGGYFIAWKRLDTKYSKIATEEMEQTREFYERKFKRGKYETVNDAVEALMPAGAHEALIAYAGGDTEFLPSRSGPLMLEEEVTQDDLRNVFEQNEQSEIDEAERRDRTEEAPYIISKDEYFEDKANHDQITLTYYQGDGVLADERDEPIEDIDATVGDDNIPRFGHGSEDPNILYVRNHHLGTDFEICLSKGKYSVEVAGLQEE